MLDELFMRQWNEGHTAFSADIDRKLKMLASRLSSQDRRYFGIDEPYQDPAPRDRLRPILAGLAACLVTASLFLTIGALAMSGRAVAAPVSPFIVLA